jgi:hypothetical protein
MEQFKIKVENNKEFREITLLDSNDKEVTLDDIISSVVDGATIGTDKPIQFFDCTSKLDFINKYYKHAKNFLDEGRVTVSFAYKAKDIVFREESYELGTLNEQITDRIKSVINIAKKLEEEVRQEQMIVVTPLCFK